jgi:hypothetical protein
MKTDTKKIRKLRAYETRNAVVEMDWEAGGNGTTDTWTSPFAPSAEERLFYDVIKDLAIFTNTDVRTVSKYVGNFNELEHVLLSVHAVDGEDVHVVDLVKEYGADVVIGSIGHINYLQSEFGFTADRATELIKEFGFGGSNEFAETYGSDDYDSRMVLSILKAVGKKPAEGFYDVQAIFAFAESRGTDVESEIGLYVDSGLHLDEELSGDALPVSGTLPFSYVEGDQRAWMTGGRPVQLNDGPDYAPEDEEGIRRQSRLGSLEPSDIGLDALGPFVDEILNRSRRTSYDDLAESMGRL